MNELWGNLSFLLTLAVWAVCSWVVDWESEDVDYIANIKCECSLCGLKAPCYHAHCPFPRTVAFFGTQAFVFGMYVLILLIILIGNNQDRVQMKGYVATVVISAAGAPTVALLTRRTLFACSLHCIGSASIPRSSHSTSSGFATMLLWCAMLCISCMSQPVASSHPKSIADNRRGPVPAVPSLRERHDRAACHPSRCV